MGFSLDLQFSLWRTDNMWKSLQSLFSVNVSACCTLISHHYITSLNNNYISLLHWLHLCMLYMHVLCVIIYYFLRVSDDLWQHASMITNCNICGSKVHKDCDICSIKASKGYFWANYAVRVNKYMQKTSPNACTCEGSTTHISYTIFCFLDTQ